MTTDELRAAVKVQNKNTLRAVGRLRGAVFPAARGVLLVAPSSLPRVSGRQLPAALFRLGLAPASYPRFAVWGQAFLS